MYLLYALLFSAGAAGQIQTPTDMEKKLGAAGADADTMKLEGWKVNAVVGAGLSQAAFSNWAQGGENSFAYTMSGLVNGTLYGERSRWSNTLSLRYGQAQIGDDEAKKTDDEIYFESIFIYRVWSPFHPYAAATLRTQFAPGYDYPDNAPRVRVSKFFDPAYLTQSVGVIYEPSAIFTSRLGVAMREVFTSEFPQYADDPETLTEIENDQIRRRHGMGVDPEVRIPPEHGVRVAPRAVRAVQRVRPGRRSLGQRRLGEDQRLVLGESRRAGAERRERNAPDAAEADADASA